MASIYRGYDEWYRQKSVEATFAQGHEKKMFEKLQDLHQIAGNLLRKMLEKDPGRRPTIDSVLKCLTDMINQEAQKTEKGVPT